MRSALQSDFTILPWKGGKTAKNVRPRTTLFIITKFVEGNRRNRSVGSWRRCGRSCRRWKRVKLLLHAQVSRHEKILCIICHTFMAYCMLLVNRKGNRIMASILMGCRWAVLITISHKYGTETMNNRNINEVQPPLTACITGGNWRLDAINVLAVIYANNSPKL